MDETVPWYFVKGGSQTYVRAFLKSFQGKTFKKTPVKGVKRHPDVTVSLENGRQETFDKVVIEVSAVIVRVSKVRAAIVFVDDATKKIFGKKYFSGSDLDKAMRDFTNEVMSSIRATYHTDVEIARQEGVAFPSSDAALNRIEDIVQEKCGA